MSDDVNISNTSLDQDVDAKVQPPTIRPEEYKKDANGNRIAATHQVTHGGRERRQSWTLSEIERTISDEVMPGGKQKLALFGVGLSRKNDFRLRDLSRRLEGQIRHDYNKEITSGPIARRIRSFDIQSQTMRMIQANAALGTYQFQRTQVLPYMRKSLALNYEKTGLLKKISTGINSLEQSLITKLEAIKLNTAASAPQHISVLKRLRTAIKDKQIDRVATNVANLIMQGYDEKYRKYISPLLNRLHQKMEEGGPKGGVNGVTSAVTRKLNSFRRVVKLEASKDTKGLTVIGKLRQRAAKMAGGTLDAAVKLGQKAKLPTAHNELAARTLSPWTAFLDKLHPFAAPGSVQPTAGGDGSHDGLPATAVADVRLESELSKLTRLTRDAHLQERKLQTQLLENVMAIREKIAPIKVIKVKAAGQKTKPALPGTPSPRKLKALVTPKLPISFPKIPKLKTFVARFKPTPVAPKKAKPAHVAAAAVKTPTHTLSRISTRLKSLVAKTPKITLPKVSPVVKGIGKVPAGLFGLGAGGLMGALNMAKKLKIPSIKPATHKTDHVVHREPPVKKVSVKKTKEKAPPRAPKVSDAEKAKARAQMILDRNAIRKKAAEDRAAARAKPRANSAEERRENDRRAREAMAAGGGLGAAAGMTDAPSSAGGGDSDDGLMNLLGGVIGEVAGKGLKLGWRGTKFAGRNIGKGAAKLSKGAFKMAARRSPGIAKGGAKLGWAITKGATKLGWKGALGGGALALGASKGGLKLAGKGGWGLAKGAGGLLKSGGVGLLKSGGGLLKGATGAGLALMGGQYLFDKYSGAKGGWKRGGDTAFSMASYGLLGAEIGALFGGVGALPGAVIGAAVGAVVANADVAAKALGAVAAGTMSAGRGFAHLLLGKNAVMTPDGHVVAPAQAPLYEGMQTLLFGRGAIYSKTGELLLPARRSLAGDIAYGFQKTFWGDKYSNGEFKEGTSLVEMMRNSVSRTMISFGKSIMELPGKIKSGFNTLVDKAHKAAVWTGEKLTQGGVAVASFASKTRDNIVSGTKNLKENATSVYNNLTFENIGKKVFTHVMGAEKTLEKASFWTSPLGFSIGISNAINGWGDETGKITNPAGAFYGFGTQVLNAYGVRNRSLYKFIHSLEISQDKINKNQAKPFDDSDMAFMAGRFGFDSKNADQVNYFKLWYKRRFVPAMALIGKVLQDHKMTFGSALAASDTEIVTVISDLKKEIASSNLLSSGLEPSPETYNKYTKVGNKDPGGVAASTLTASKPFNPRDPKNRQSAYDGRVNSLGAPMGGSRANSAYNPSNDNFSSGPAKASRNRAQLVKGDVTAQPEYRAALAKLSPKLKAMVEKSKALQFVLWSTSIQHGADTAAKIFTKDYSDGLDDAGYIRTIYQDRATRFNDLGNDDRTEAIAHLGEEMRFADGIRGGSAPSMADMSREVNNTVSPYMPAGGTGNLKGIGVSGSMAARAKDAVQYMMSKGLTKTAALAIVGNLMVESGLRTNVPGDNGAAYGLAQWHSERQRNIAGHFGKTLQNMGFHEQLDAVLWEMSSGVKGAVTGGINLIAKLNKETNLGSAVGDVVNLFERPKERTNNIRNRTRLAMGVDAAMSGAPNTSAMGTPGKSGGSATSAAAPYTAPMSGPLKGGPQTSSSGGALLKVPSKPAPTKKAATAPAPAAAPDMTPWAQALKDHTKALVALTPKLQPQHTTAVVPINKPAAPNPAANFVSMSMKKTFIATGDH